MIFEQMFWAGFLLWPVETTTKKCDHDYIKTEIDTKNFLNRYDDVKELLNEITLYTFILSSVIPRMQDPAIS